MLLTNHVLSGALIGALIRRPVPGLRGGRGLALRARRGAALGRLGSNRRFLQVAVPDGLISLAGDGHPRRGRPPPNGGWPCWRA